MDAGERVPEHREHAESRRLLLPRTRCHSLSAPLTLILPTQTVHSRNIHYCAFSYPSILVPSGRLDTPRHFKLARSLTLIHSLLSNTYTTHSLTLSLTISQIFLRLCCLQMRVCWRLYECFLIDNGSGERKEAGVRSFEASVHCRRPLRIPQVSYEKSLSQKKSSWYWYCPLCSIIPHTCNTHYSHAESKCFNTASVHTWVCGCINGL